MLHGTALCCATCGMPYTLMGVMLCDHGCQIMLGRSGSSPLQHQPRTGGALLGKPASGMQRQRLGSSQALGSSFGAALLTSTPMLTPRLLLNLHPT